MTDSIHVQAAAVTDLLPKLMRRLFQLDTEDPVTELPVAQLRVCGILRDGPKAMSCLSREMGISLSATTQIADRLERSGLVERVTEAEDRRIKCLQLTSHGLEIMSARFSKRVKRVEQVLQNLAPEDREEIVSVLSRLYEIANAHHPGSLPQGERENPSLIKGARGGNARYPLDPTPTVPL